MKVLTLIDYIKYSMNHSNDSDLDFDEEEEEDMEDLDYQKYMKGNYNFSKGQKIGKIDNSDAGSDDFEFSKQEHERLFAEILASLPQNYQEETDKRIKSILQQTLKVDIQDS